MMRNNPVTIRPTKLMTDRIEKHIKAVSANATAIELLASQVHLSKQQLKAAMSNGAVWLESNHGIQRIRRAKKEIKKGDTLHLYYDQAIQSTSPDPAALIADENEFSIWIKPPGMYSQGSKWGDHCTIYRWAEQHLRPRRTAYLVHRLDRAANGLMILAHNKKTATAFLQLFKQGAVIKRYRVVVNGELSLLRLPCTITEPLDNKPAESVIMQVNHVPGERTSSLNIELKAGRKHQIRRHMASLGHAVVGDRLYGASDHEGGLQLSSEFLSFTGPHDGKPHSYSLNDYRMPD